MSKKCEIIICDNLGEFFTKFKEFRTLGKISSIANKENFKWYINSGLGFWEVVLNTENGRATDELVSVFTNIWETKNRVHAPEKKLVLKLPNLKGQEWRSYSKKIIKVLHEIWEMGEIKNSQNLDLNWPVASKKNDKPVENNSPKNTNKESKEDWWIGGGIGLIFVLACLKN